MHMSNCSNVKGPELVISGVGNRSSGHTKPYIKTINSMQQRLCNDGLEPDCAKSKADKSKSRQEMPYTNVRDPKQEGLLVGKDSSGDTESGVSRSNSGQAIPYRGMKKPECMRERNGMLKPRCTKSKADSKDLSLPMELEHKT
eukprot:3240073-Amphidinium_carterae.2